MTTVIGIIWIIVGIWAGLKILNYYFKPECFLSEFIIVVGCSILGSPFTLIWALYLKYENSLDKFLSKRINLQQWSTIQSSGLDNHL